MSELNTIERPPVLVRPADVMIPMDLWGKDHWSTLAYVETVMVDCGGVFQIGLDARMRHNRRHFRVMHQQCPRPGRAGRTSVQHAMVMDPLNHRTRLNDGSQVENHDDWCCIQDMIETGLFALGMPTISPRICRPEDCEPGVNLRLSPLGLKVAAWVREQKMRGVNFGAMRARRDDFCDGEPAVT